MSQKAQLNIKIPVELKKLISEMSKENGRSLNSEVQIRLEKSFESPTGSYIDAMEELRDFFDAHLRSKRLLLISEKLNFLLSESEAVGGFYTPSISRIAEVLEYNSVGKIESWFEGRIEPLFEELEELARYFGCQTDWLIHDENKPYKKEKFEFGSNIEDNAKRLLQGNDQDEVKALWFARNNTENGELIIIKHYDTWRGSVLDTRVHISEKVGIGGSEDRALLSLTLKYLCRYHLLKIQGAIISEADYNELIWARENPIKIIEKYRHSHWIEDIWDSSMYSKKNNSYWKGWYEMCMSNAAYIDRNKSLFNMK